MELTPYIEQLREDLLAAAALGGEEVRRAATVLGAAIEPSARLAIMNALSDLAAEVTGALDGTTVDIRLDGRDVRVHVTRAETDEPDGAADFSWQGRFDPRVDDLRSAMTDAGGELSRTTVRLFNDLKSQAEQAASDQGVSLNSYISRAISDALGGAVPPGAGRGRRGDARRLEKDRDRSRDKGRDRGDRGDRTITGYFQA
jgi:hypothetical protein